MNLDPVSAFSAPGTTRQWCVPTLIARIMDIPYERACGVLMYFRKPNRRGNIGIMFLSEYEGLMEGQGFRQHIDWSRCSKQNQFLVREIMLQYPFGTYVLLIPGHIILMVDGKLYDNTENPGEFFKQRHVLRIYRKEQTA